MEVLAVYAIRINQNAAKSISEQRMIQKVVIVQQQDFMKKFDPWQLGPAG